MNKHFIISTITSYQPQILAVTPVSAAVVVMILEDEQNNFSIIVTKRAPNVPTYAGDYCFPGGIKEEYDSDHVATAQREVAEELAIKKNQYELIGQLDDFFDRFGNLVRPYVAWMKKAEFEKNYSEFDGEVDGIFYLPIDEIKQFKIDENLEGLTKRHPSYIYHQDEVVIWGLTAGIMVHLGNVVFGLDRELGKGTSQSIS